jgi:hypothetical protein
MPNDQEMKGRQVRLGEFLDAALGQPDANKPDIYAVLLAGHAGDWRPGEEIMEAYARALRYSGPRALRLVHEDEFKERRFLSAADLFLRHGMDIDDVLPTKDIVRKIGDLLAALPDELIELASAAGVGAPPPADA